MMILKPQLNTCEGTFLFRETKTKTYDYQNKFARSKQTCSCETFAWCFVLKKY